MSRPRIEWHLHRHGAPAPTPLVWLHGFLGTGADWAPVAAHGGPGALAPDLPRHGATRVSPEDAPVGMDATAAALDAWLGHTTTGRCVLAGYSLGGRVALHTALAFPGRIAALVLESASPGIADDDARARRRAHDARWAARFESEPLAEVLGDWYRQPVFADVAADPAAHRAAVARRMRVDGPRAARSLRELGQGASPPLWERLGDVRCPVLLLAGSRDEKYEETMREAADRLPAASLEVVEGAGHDVHSAAPAAYAERLARFLTDHGLSNRHRRSDGHDSNLEERG